MIIISIDVGYHNMALVGLKADDDFNLVVTSADVVDLTSLPHRRVSRCDCGLSHTSEVADLMAHFFQEYGYMLDEADLILVERQPPTGLTQIETLILYLYRNKTQLVSPNAMHAHFGINQYEYDRRKEKTLAISEEYLQNFHNLGRRHDAADAVCLALFYVKPLKDRARRLKIDRTLPFSEYTYEGGV